ncbi:hypothetical protein HN51_020563 [Arachis hypogaea]
MESMTWPILRSCGWNKDRERQGSCKRGVGNQSGLLRKMEVKVIVITVDIGKSCPVLNTSESNSPTT